MADLEHLNPSDPFYPDAGAEAINDIRRVLMGYKLSQQLGRVCLVSESPGLIGIAEVFHRYFSSIDDGSTLWRPSEEYAARLGPGNEWLRAYTDWELIMDLHDPAKAQEARMRLDAKDVESGQLSFNRAILADRLLFPLPMPGWLDTQSVVGLRTDDDAFTAWLDSLRGTVSRLATVRQPAELQEAITEERTALGERARVVRQKVQRAPTSLYRKAGFQALVTSAVLVTGTLALLPNPSLSVLLGSSAVGGTAAGLAALVNLKDVPLQGADLALWHLQK